MSLRRSTRTRQTVNAYADESEDEEVTAAVPLSDSEFSEGSLPTVQPVASTSRPRKRQVSMGVDNEDSDSDAEEVVNEPYRVPAQVNWTVERPFESLSLEWALSYDFTDLLTVRWTDCALESFANWSRKIYRI